MTLIIILSISYLISMILIYYALIYNEFQNLNREEKFLSIILTVSPLNIFLVLFALAHFIPEGIGYIVGNIRDKRRKKIELKNKIYERERKIKLGIIRFNENDPYGEEDWEI